MRIDYTIFPSGKNYTFLHDGKRRIFLRNILFLHKPDDAGTIVIVREWGAKTNDGVWEPPKGQMEWKEIAAAGIRRGEEITPSQLVALMSDGVLREMEEEAKIRIDEIHDLRLLPMSYTEEFRGVPHAKRQNHDAVDAFRYQFWAAELVDLGPAIRRMNKIVANSGRGVSADCREKDAVEWWRPTRASDWVKIRPAFSSVMTKMYYDFIHEDTKK
jgi:8-oxo-dGTP pyrophosphatase MutT (NUDIX family)